MTIKMEKRGQAALEFLMTYGWAILVVLVAIGALAYFGVLRPERLLPEKCVIATGSGVYCDDFSATTTGVTFRLKNMLPESITLSSVSITATGETCAANTNATVIASDATGDVIVTCSTLASGDKLKGDVAIAYTKSGGLSKQTTGQLVTVVP
ncbi:MAG: hypothetical protein V1660_03725 [archaeon]